MATKLVILCDVPVRQKPHGVEATNAVDVTIANKRYHGDICDEHMPLLAEVFAKVGIELKTPAKKAASKPKKKVEMRTKSGKVFTAADARPWLIEQGLIEEAAAGRISQENLTKYADAH